MESLDIRPLFPLPLAEDYRNQPYVLCIPVYNEWACIVLLLRSIEQIVRQHGIHALVLLVDDGSTESPPTMLPDAFAGLPSIEVLRLRRNVGHQRAIALGLAYIAVHLPCRGVVVMDGDGEDSPDDIPRLIKKFESHGESRIVFARRARRSEGLLFRFSYAGYRILHYLLTGVRVQFGNFSVISQNCLQQLVACENLWNHCTAAAIKARLPYDSLPTNRAERLAGKSKMNFVSLVTHGLSAISVFSEIAGVRLLTISALIGLLSCVIGGVAVGVGVVMNWTMPSWVPLVAALLATLVIHAMSFSVMFTLLVLQSRNSSTFQPLRDYHFYIRDLQPLLARQAPAHSVANTHREAA